MADDPRGGKGDVVGLFGIAKHVAQFDQRGAQGFATPLHGDVGRHAGNPQRIAAGVEERLPARRDPANLAVGSMNPIDDIIVGAVGDAPGHLGRALLAIVGMDRVEPIVIGERLIDRPSENLLAGLGGDQLPTDDIESPGAEPCGSQRKR